MTRGNLRELALHLIYSWEFTGDDPDQVVSDRLEAEYYNNLAEEYEVYAERPSRKQVNYIVTVVAGVSRHLDELNSIISAHAIGWDISRISRLARAVMQLAIFEVPTWKMCPRALLCPRLCVLPRSMTVMIPAHLSTVSSAPGCAAAPHLPKQQR